MISINFNSYARLYFSSFVFFCFVFEHCIAIISKKSFPVLFADRVHSVRSDPIVTLIESDPSVCAKILWRKVVSNKKKTILEIGHHCFQLFNHKSI